MEPFDPSKPDAAYRDYENARPGVREFYRANHAQQTVAFVRGRHEAFFHARAVEEPAPKVNGGQLRCERDGSGRCTSVDLCGEPGEEDDDCLGSFEPRAWSSPIYVDFAGSATMAARGGVD